MKKILFAIHSLGFGGAERSLVNLLHELPSDQFEIDLLLFQMKGAFLQQVPSWVRIMDTPEALDHLYGSVRRAGKYTVTKVFGTACAKLLRRKRKTQRAYRWKYFYRRRIKPLPTHYDAAIAYVGTEVMYFVRDCVSADRKLVWIHNDYRTASYSKADDMPYFADMSAIVSVSDECVNVLKEEFPQYGQKIHYVENITSSVMVRRQAEAFKPEEYQDDVCNILSVGRLSVQKGFDLAIEAAAILKECGVKFRWFVIGTGDQKEKLEEMVRDLSLEDHFILLGTRNNPYPYMKHCTIFAQTSRFEGKSVALDEAKILCAPILITAYPTAADQVIGEKEGLITQLSPQAIADGIIAMQEGNLRLQLQNYLMEHEYGNQAEIKKYLRLLDA